MNEYLTIKWTISRARDTYGWNICTLTDTRGRKARCGGGGYDMTGTVLGEWLHAWHQAELMQVRERAHQVYVIGDRLHDTGGDLYGLTWHRPSAESEGWVRIDGAVGIESVRKIARAAGIEVRPNYKQGGRNRGETLGFMVSPVENGGTDA
jgi:hypothetical protein